MTDKQALAEAERQVSHWRESCEIARKAKDEVKRELEQERAAYSESLHDKETELKQLRADIERAQADTDKSDQLSLEYLRERDEAIRAGNVTAALLAETRAALESAKAGQYEAQRLYAEFSDKFATEQLAVCAARADLAKLTEQWALDWLQHWQNTAPSDNLEMRLACRPVPAPVARLVRAGAGLPVGECARCNGTFPLVKDSRYVCDEDCASGRCPARPQFCAPGCGCSRKAGA